MKRFFSHITVVICLLVPFLSVAQSVKSDKVTVKVSVLIQDPIVNGKRLHEICKTPGRTYQWNDPWQLTADYKKTLEEMSGGTVEYEIVEIIDSKEYFSVLNKSKERLTEARVVELMLEPDWKTLKEEDGTSFDYKAFTEYYAYNARRDAGVINEVWVWTFPYCGMYESNMIGKGAFWLNSDPTKGVDCKELLCIMGLNYERDLACAMESYGHRFESIMMEVYDWWNYKDKKTRNDLTNWELYTAYWKEYNKYNPGTAHIGNIHFPPNGEKDYDWKNPKQVYTYVDSWANYPNVKDENPRLVDCSEWNCSHIGYMKFWFSHIPHFAGVNPADGKLNNWWYYVVDYNNALKLQKELNKKK